MEKQINLKLIAAFFLIVPQSGYTADPLFTDATSIEKISGSNLDQTDPEVKLQDQGSGLAWIDFNNDDWPDLYIVNVNGPNRLYKNNRADGINNFTLVNLDQDLNPAEGDDSALINKLSHTVTVGDYNNDGFDDLFVTNRPKTVGGNIIIDGTNNMLRNNGNGTFTDVPFLVDLSQDEIENERISNDNAASFADVDEDGDLDLLVIHWQNGKYRYFQNQLNTATGNYEFTLVSNGLDVATQIWGGHTSIFSDYDGIGGLDVIIPTDFGDHNRTVFKNNNDGSHTFSVDIPASLLAGTAGNAMGITAGDYNRDGSLDYFITNSASLGADINVMLQNNEAGGFTSVSSDVGTTGLENLPMPALDGDVAYIYWGTAFLDADNDGDLDLYAANDDRNFAGPSPVGKPITDLNRLYRNDGPDQENNYKFTLLSR